MISSWVGPLFPSHSPSSFLERCRTHTRRIPIQGQQTPYYCPQCVFQMSLQPVIESSLKGINVLQESLKTPTLTSTNNFSPLALSQNIEDFKGSISVMDLDPATAKLIIPYIGPFLSAFSFLFILRIVMSWYPKLPVGKFPYVLAYAPTEPLLVPTRKVIPPLGGVDVTPVVWFGLLSFLNEILVGPQGLLVLLSQQVQGQG